LLSGPLGMTVMTVFVLFFIGILLFAFVLVGSSMHDTAAVNSTARTVINETVAGAGDFAEFSPVLWIMAAIGALLAILIGSIGVYFMQRM